MLTATPKSGFSWDFLIYDEGRLLTELDLSWFRERGNFTLHGKDFIVLRKGWLRSEFTLESEGQELATAEKTSAFFRSFQVNLSGQSMELRAASPLTRRFLLVDATGRQIGSVVPNHWFTRRCTIDFPDDIDLPVRVFLFLLVLFLWRRAASSSSS